MMHTNRLNELFAKPETATSDEVRTLAQIGYKARRNSGTKTLRDEFAMAALTGMCASSVINASNREHAEIAYALADTMMEVRGQ